MTNKEEIEIDFIQPNKTVGKLISANVFDKMKDEFISRYPKNYAGGLQMDGDSCVFSLNKVLDIIDKYKALEQEMWIPCSEKSPDINERLALLYDNGLVSGGKYLGDKTYDVDFPDQNKKTRVVAWTPIQSCNVESKEEK